MKYGKFHNNLCYNMIKMRKCQSPGGILPQCAKNAWAGISGISKVFPEMPDFRNCLRLIRYIMLRG